MAPTCHGPISCSTVLTEVDTTRTTPVWGTDLSLSAPHAALVNGTQVQGFELDDVHRQGVLHVGAVTLPALFAVIEQTRPTSTAASCSRQRSPGTRSVRASASAWGRSISARAGTPVRRSASSRQLRAPPAALRLDEERTIHALGIAGTQSAGLMAAQYGAMVKRMHAGRSAQSGLYGALLAQTGLHRDRRRVRGALWRILHDVLALAGPL